MIQVKNRPQEGRPRNRSETRTSQARGAARAAMAVGETATRTVGDANPASPSIQPQLNGDPMGACKRTGPVRPLGPGEEPPPRTS